VNAEFISSMSCQSIPGHQLISNLDGEIVIETPGFVDPSQLGAFSLWRSRKFPALARQIRALRVGLGADGDIFPGSHGQRPGSEAGDGSE
jgi:hypothetical protein